MISIKFYVYQCYLRYISTLIYVSSEVEFYSDYLHLNYWYATAGGTIILLWGKVG